MNRGANIVFLAALLVSFCACGVKGDPKPPLTPAEIGHGQPSFKRASKALAPVNAPDPETVPEQPNKKSTTPAEEE